mgnify:CR=1 FL=1
MFQLTGTFSTPAVATLKAKGDATALQGRFAEHVAAVNGRIVHFLFVAGDIRFICILDMPRAGVAKIMLGLTASGVAVPGSLRLNRVRTDMAEVDRELAGSIANGQPWPVAGGQSGTSRG